MNSLSGLKTTTIGSMPHLETAPAFSLLEKYPLDIPSWPQFPKRTFKEGMVPQFSEGFPGLKVNEAEKSLYLEKDARFLDNLTAFYEAVVEEKLDYFALSAEYAAGLHAFLEWLSARERPLPVVKGQVTGPFTFGLGVNDQDGRSIWYDEEYRDVVLKGLIMKGKWQLSKLKAKAERVLLFYDEPILSGLGTSAYLNLTDDHVIETVLLSN